MSGSWRLLEFALLSGFIVAFALSVLIAVLWPLITRGLGPLAAERRARIAWWLLVGPALVGLLYALATLLSGTGGAVLPAIQASCVSHQSDWWHACLWHPMERGDDPWLWLALAAVAAALLSTMLRTALAVWRGQQQLRTLIALSRGSQVEGDVLVVNAAAPLAFAVGVGRGQVLLSRALVQALTPGQLDAVIAHERAHLRNGDVLRHLLARALSLIHLPTTRRHLINQLILATEQRCDRAAAAQVGSALLVAEALLVVERLHRSNVSLRPLLAVAFANGFLAERIQALIAPRETANYPLGHGLLVALLGFVTLSAGWVHHLTESLVLLTAG